MDMHEQQEQAPGEVARAELLDHLENDSFDDEALEEDDEIVVAADASSSSGQDVKDLEEAEDVTSSSTPQRKRSVVLMDAMHDATFDVAEFRRQMALHTFWPFSLAWYPKSRWPQGARNQFLLPFQSGLRSTLWHSTPLFCWLTLAAYLATPKRFDREGVGVHSLFTVPFILATSRTVLIAIKYATLSKAERHRFLTETNQSTVTRWLLQTQLISGWLSQRDDVLRSELAGAASRLDIDLHNLFFVVEPLSESTACEATRVASFQAWENLVKSGSAHLSVHDFFEHPDETSRGGLFSAGHDDDGEGQTSDDDDDERRADDDDDDEATPKTKKKTSSFSSRRPEKKRATTPKKKKKETRTRFAAAEEPKEWRQREVFGTRHIRCELVIEVLLRAARAKAPIIRGNQATFFGALLALLPRALAVAVESDLAALFGSRTGPALCRRNRGSPDWLVLACLVVSVSVTTTVASVFLIFLSVNVCHYYRTYVVDRWLALLIRASFESHPRFPQIQLCATRSRFGGHNVLAWLKCRSILCFFGKRYENRLDAYMLMVSFLSIVAVVVPFLRLLQAGGFGGSADDDELRRDLDRMKESAFLWTSLFLFGTTATMLTLTVLFAAHANLELDKSLGSLTHHRLRLHGLSVDEDTLRRRQNEEPATDGSVYRRDGSYGAHKSKSEMAFDAQDDLRGVIDDFEDTLQLAKEELDVLNRIHVLKVLGHPAEVPFALSIATTSATIAGYVIAAVFGLLL